MKRPFVPRIAHAAGAAPFRAHALEGGGRVGRCTWKGEDVELATVGIDVGSRTSQMVFTSVRLQRRTHALSSQLVVAGRKVVWRSPVRATPHRSDGTIDAVALGAFVDDGYAQAGIAPGAIDSGAVILTGEAIARADVREIARQVAADSRRFVCASAGPHFECVLAAHGSGAVALSRDSGRRVLNVDLGGATTKLALVEGGRVVATTALAFGAGSRALDVEACEAVVSLLAGEPPDERARGLLRAPPLPEGWSADGLVFSGGVAEYIYGCELRDFGDAGKAVAERFVAACAAGRVHIPVLPAQEAIRATAVGASQFGMQVSGRTLHGAAGAQLPLRNVPVIDPALDLEAGPDAGAVARSIREALARSPCGDEGPVALAVRWRGEPLYARLRALAEGIASGLAPRGAGAGPLVLLVDGDVGRTLGQILEKELAIGRDVVSIDGIQLREFDFVDIGDLTRPADMVPVVVKSLLFPGAPAARPGPGGTAYRALGAAPGNVE